MFEPIRPNFHMVLIHFPIALLTIGTFIEVFSFLGWRNSSLRSAARWMILFGALGAFAAATSGLYALRQMAGAGSELTWREMRASPLLSNDVTRDLLFDHLWLGVGAGAGAMFIVLFWIAACDRSRSLLQIPLALLMLCALGALFSGMNHGGRAVFEHGVGVSSTITPTTSPKTSHYKLVDFVPPLELHVSLAGLAVGLTLVSLATSWRAAIELRRPKLPALRQEQEAALIAAELDNEPLTERRAPAGRAWLIGWLLLLLTASSGIWYLAHDIGSWSLTDLRSHVTRADGQLSRRTVHVIAGVALLVVPLVFAFFSRVARRSRLMILLLLPATLALLVVQVWVGCLMLLDTPDGPTFKFQPEQVITSRPVSV